MYQVLNLETIFGIDIPCLADRGIWCNHVPAGIGNGLNPTSYDCLIPGAQLLDLATTTTTPLFLLILLSLDSSFRT